MSYLAVNSDYKAGLEAREFDTPLLLNDSVNYNMTEVFSFSLPVLTELVPGWMVLLEKISYSSRQDVFQSSLHDWTMCWISCI